MLEFNASIKHYTAQQYAKVTLEEMPGITWDAYNISEYIKYSVTFHAGKLEDVASISTFRDENPNCQRFRQIPGSICQDCYVSDYSYRTSLTKKLIKNTWFYTHVELTPDAVPLLPYIYIRFESFGDLINKLQFNNYCVIASANKHSNCALWTKFPFIIKQALKEHRKPENLQIVYSWLYKNGIARQTTTAPEYIDTKAFKAYTEKHFPFIDRVFIVYDYTFAMDNDISINCQRKCNACTNSCYINNNTFYVNELEKHSAKGK